MPVPKSSTHIVTRRAPGNTTGRPEGALLPSAGRQLDPGERPGTAAERALANAAVRRVRSTDQRVVAAPKLKTPRRRGVAVAICGQAALAHVSGRSVDEVIRVVGHDGPMLFREIKRYLEQQCRLAPTVILADALRSGAVRLWWQYGGDGFRAILGDLRNAPTHNEITREEMMAGVEPATPLGHVVVVEGRTLIDLGGDRAQASVQRFSPRDLARFDAALVLSPSGQR